MDIDSINKYANMNTKWADFFNYNPVKKQEFKDFINENTNSVISNNFSFSSTQIDNNIGGFKGDSIGSFSRNRVFYIKIERNQFESKIAECKFDFKKKRRHYEFWVYTKKEIKNIETFITTEEGLRDTDQKTYDEMPDKTTDAAKEQKALIDAHQEQIDLSETNKKVLEGWIVALEANIFFNFTLYKDSSTRYNNENYEDEKLDDDYYKVITTIEFNHFKADLETALNNDTLDSLFLDGHLEKLAEDYRNKINAGFTGKHVNEKITAEIDPNDKKILILKGPPNKYPFEISQPKTDNIFPFKDPIEPSLFKVSEYINSSESGPLKNNYIKDFFNREFVDYDKFLIAPNSDKRWPSNTIQLWEKNVNYKKNTQEDNSDQMLDYWIYYDYGLSRAMGWNLKWNATENSSTNWFWYEKIWQVYRKNWNSYSLTFLDYNKISPILFIDSDKFENNKVIGKQYFELYTEEASSYGFYYYKINDKIPGLDEIKFNYKIRKSEKIFMSKQEMSRKQNIMFVNNDKCFSYQEFTSLFVEDIETVRKEEKENFEYTLTEYKKKITDFIEKNKNNKKGEKKKNEEFEGFEKLKINNEHHNCKHGCCHKNNIFPKKENNLGFYEYSNRTSKSLKISFVTEFFETGHNENRVFKPPSSKAGYFTTTWSDKEERESISRIKPKVDPDDNVNKIHVYLDRDVKGEDIDPIFDSLEYWNSTFISAGSDVTLFYNKDYPFDKDVYRYLNSITMCDITYDTMGVASCTLDGETGDVLLSAATYNSLVHKVNPFSQFKYYLIDKDHENLEEYLLKGSNMKETIAKLEKYELTNTIAHEIGHTLGLRHNFAGTTTLEGKEFNTVMDYVFLSNGKYTVFRKNTVPGIYDILAIKYGYTNASDIDLDGTKTLYVTDGISSLFPLIGAYDVENKLNDINVDKYIESIRYWVDIYDNNTFSNAITMDFLETKEKFVEYKFLISRSEIKYNIISIITACLNDVNYYILNGKLQRIPVDQVKKLLDLVIELLINRKLYVKKDIRDALLSVSSESELYPYNPQELYIYNDLYYMIDWYTTGWGQTNMDISSEYFEKDTKRVKKWQFWTKNVEVDNPFNQVVNRMYVISLICKSHVQKKNWSENVFKMGNQGLLKNEIKDILKNNKSISTENIDNMFLTTFDTESDNVFRGNPYKDKNGYSMIITLLIQLLIILISRFFLTKKKTTNALKNVFKLFKIK